MRALALAAGVLAAAAVGVSAWGTPGTVRAGTPVALGITSVDVAGAAIRGPGDAVRGPAVGVLADGRVVLGGGPDGRRLFLADPATGGLAEVGVVIAADQRQDDARYGPTDIEVMAQGNGRARLFVSYPQYLPGRGCVRVAVDRVDITTDAAPRVLATARVFRSHPCVKSSGVQQAGGRLVRISAKGAYLSVGDLSSPLIASRSVRGQLGTVQRIGEGVRARRISQGHRNPQGLMRDSRGQLWETEHGPQGGDELNLIRRGRDYGWPFVTLGQPYGPNDYVQPRRTGTHAGYTGPRTAWVPSVATSEIVEVPTTWNGWTNTWDGWVTPVGGDFLMGTLKDQSLWRIRVSRSNRVIERERIAVGERIRDLDVRPDSSVVASTDSGRLLVIRPDVPAGSGL